MVEELLKKIPQAVVYEDTEYRGAIWNMERIFTDYPEGVLRLEEDIIVPPWFLEEAEKSMIPDENMSFFIAMNPWAREAYDAGFSYARVVRQVWGQANYHPAWAIKGYMKWAADQPASVAEGHFRGWDKPTPNNADNAFRNWLKTTGRSFYLTLPNLVNHRLEKSVVGNARRSKGMSWVSYVYGKSLLRPWNKDAITDAPK